ncbi:hypothetical protein KUCAC02_022184, partial [Chaenocephalus aceratus]
LLRLPLQLHQAPCFQDNKDSNRHACVISPCHRPHPDPHLQHSQELPSYSQNYHPENLLHHHRQACGLQTSLHYPLWWQASGITDIQNHNPCEE